MGENFKNKISVFITNKKLPIQQDKFFIYRELEKKLILIPVNQGNKS